VTGSLWVVKVGGALCEDPHSRRRLARACAALGRALVLVHGGGGGVSRLQKKLGLEPRFVEGRRVTGPEDLDAAEMVLTGSVNQALVRDLQSEGMAAVGLSGCDGGLLLCRRVDGLGHVGTPDAVEPRLLNALLASGFTPVISPISLGPEGEPVNVNADEVACAIAAAMGADRLLLLSDVEGVRVSDEWRIDVMSGEVEMLIASGQVTDGMVPKLRAASAAAAAGVREVRIAGYAGGPLADVRGTGVRAGAAPPEPPAPGTPDESSLLAGVFHYPRLMLARGEGSWVWDVEGRRYLDFTAGLGVAALGHGRRDLAVALLEQFATLAHCSNLYGNLPALELARRLKERSFAHRIWFANSGTEANEAAIKFGRLHGRHAGGGRKSALVAFKGGFHGRTLGALAATHHPEYRAPFAPLVPGVRFGRFNDLASARRVMDERVCAVIVEPVQGEGGVVPAEPEFLEGLRALCDEHGALLIFDEVQCGLGRLGFLHAYQAYGVIPDMAVLAKPLGGGLPLGAVLLNEQVAALLRPGQHGSTFAGGPSACTVATRVLDAISQPEFLAHVGLMGERLRAGLEALAAESPVFRSARGLGLMQALVVADPRRVDPGDVVRRAREHGLLVGRAGEDAVRLLPPLNCSEGEVDHALDVLREVSREVAEADQENKEALLVGAREES